MSLGKYVGKLKGLESAFEISDVSTLYFMIEVLKLQAGSSSALVDHLIALATTDGDAEAVALLNGIKTDAQNAGTAAAAPVSGDTASRPTLGMSDTGSEYFDTDLGQPIWWNGTAWVDSTGTPV